MKPQHHRDIERVRQRAQSLYPGRQTETGPDPVSYWAWIASLATIGTVVAGEMLAWGHNPWLRLGGVALLLPAGIFILSPFY